MKNPETNPFSLIVKLISHHYAGLIAVILVGCTCYLWMVEKPVPEMLSNLTLIVVSFLFGKKVGSAPSDSGSDSVTSKAD
jgi:hypothetical protein